MWDRKTKVVLYVCSSRGTAEKQPSSPPALWRDGGMAAKNQRRARVFELSLPGGQGPRGEAGAGKPLAEGHGERTRLLPVFRSVLQLKSDWRPAGTPGCKRADRWTAGRNEWMNSSCLFLLPEEMWFFSGLMKTWPEAETEFRFYRVKCIETGELIVLWWQVCNELKDKNNFL